MQEQSYAERIVESLPEGTTIFTVLRHVSRSGATRVIDVAVPVEMTDGRLDMVYLRSLPRIGRRLDRKRDGFRISGGGMDFGAELVDDIGRAYHGDGRRFRHRWL
jgi:hypothetical protein